MVFGMGTLHRSIGENGKQGTLQFGEFCRAEVEAAAAYMADEDNAIGYLYSGWCQAALPHRKLPDEKGWQVKSGPVALIVQPGMRMGPDKDPIPVGVPYGSRARLILIYLQSEAIRTQSREVELGRSLRVWMGRLGISIGGDSVSAVKDQADRIARCSMTFEVSKGESFGLFKQNIVDSAMFEDGASGSQRGRDNEYWPTCADEFWPTPGCLRPAEPGLGPAQQVGVMSCSFSS